MVDSMGRDHPNNFQWNQELDTELRDLWGKVPTVEIAQRFHCTHHTINRRAIRLSLPKRLKQNELWAEWMVTKLREMWTEGYTTAVIGHELGVSRNAVIGKRMRLGLPQRGRTPQRGRGNSTPRKRSHKRIQDNRIATAVKTLTHAPANMDTFDAANPGIGILELRLSSCRSILRTGREGARYCGEEIATDKKTSFCPGHHAIYYRPANRS